MADKKISALTAATTPLAGTEVLPIVQSGSTVKVSIADVTAGRAVSATSLTAGLGAVATPSYTFTGDLNTGMWSPAADTLAFSEGGAEVMRITSAGSVGIGTSSPATPLSVNGSATANENFFAATGGVWFNAANTFTRGVAQAGSDINFFTSGTERMRINSSGNVGVNETIPDYKLDVNGTFGFTPGASVTPVDNGDVVFELTSNTTLTIKAKGSDGVVRSGTIVLV
jgi:hypothetical protein